MAKTLKLSLTGLPTVQRNLRILGPSARFGLRKALFREGEELMTESKPLTPLLTGNLRNSGTVTLPTQTRRQIIVQVGYGGPAGAGNQEGTNKKDVGYALVQHEKHQTRSKFLERPFDKRSKGLARRIAQDLRRTVDNLKLKR